MAWTDDRVEILKKLWLEGLSASQIAMELGGVTRNAVIGKVHRLGLSGRGKTPRAPSRPRAPRPRQNNPKPKHSGGATIGNAALDIQHDENPVPLPNIQRYEELVIPFSERANIMDLTECTCRWPIGDPTSSDFHFCGKKSAEESPYCSYHSKIAYQPASERRQKRA